MPSESSVPSRSHRELSLAPRIALSALLLGTALFFEGLLLGRTIPVFRDLLLFAVPYKEFLASHLRHGLIPLWNPWLALGTPFLAALQTGVFYPPSLLLLFGLPLGFDLFIVFHYFVALLGAWFLIRSRGCSVLAASVAALSFTFGGYLLSMMNVTNHLQAGAWAPWVLLAWERHLDEPSLDRWLVFALAVAVQILAGAPETSLMTLTLAAGETLYASVARRRFQALVAFSLGAAVFAAVSLTAIQVVPTAEYVRQSARNQALPEVEVLSWSMQPLALLQLLFPHGSALGPGDHPGDLSPILETTQPWIVSLYLGLVPLCLAVVGAAVHRERWLWGSAAVAALVLGLGKHLPVLPFLLHVAPELVGRFRFPEKFFFIVQVAVTMLAAFGAEALAARDPRAERVAWLTAATLAVPAAACILARSIFPAAYLHGIVELTGRFRGASALASLGESLAFRAWRALLVLGTFSALLFFWRKAILSRASASVLLAGLVAVDLGATHYDLNLSVPWAALSERPPFADLAELRREHLRLFHYQTDSAAFPGEKPKPVRGLVHLIRLDWKTDSARSLFEQGWQALLFNTPMLERVGTLSGGDAITRGSENMLSDALSLPTRAQAVKLLRIFSVLYLVGATPLDLPTLESVPTPHDFPFHVYRLAGVVPHAYLATRVRSVGADLDAFNRLISSDFEPGVDAVVSSPLEGGVGRCEEASPGVVILEKERDESQVFRVETSCRVLLVVNDSYFPGWSAALDGRPTRILRTNALVRGVVVPPGRHEVSFDYSPVSFRVGAAISSVTAVLLALLFVGARMRRRKQPADPERAP